MKGRDLEGDFAPVGAGFNRLAADIDVSRETFERFEIYCELLQRWQTRINLISSGTLSDIWTRHIADCAQVRSYGSAFKTWADLGSGAGLPGIILAIQLMGAPDALVHLIESDKKKCAFLREAIRAVDAPAIVHNGRLDDVLPELNIEALTSRALAPIPKLIEWTADKIVAGATGIFLTGRKPANALTPPDTPPNFKIAWHPNKLDPTGFVAVVTART